MSIIRTVCRYGVLLGILLGLTGCASLLERSYSAVEPYSDRYWDSTDTLRAENRQDLVNSLLMLVEQRAEEGVIRCYEQANSYLQVRSACLEVSGETALGSYLLEKLTFQYESGPGYSTASCTMVYREDTEDPDQLLTLSDTQSLVDLLRLAVREKHEKLTARFAYNTPREEVTAAAESLWQELWDGGAEPVIAPAPPEESGETPPPEEETDVFSEIPPCPWEVRFYPDTAEPEIVEVLLDGSF